MRISDWSSDVCSSDLTAGQAGDIIKVANDFMAPIERDRIALTKPYRDAADAAKATCDQFLQPLLDALDRLRARLKAWSDEEDERIEKRRARSEEHTSELQSLMRSSYAGLCLKKKKKTK